MEYHYQRASAEGFERRTMMATRNTAVSSPRSQVGEAFSSEESRVQFPMPSSTPSTMMDDYPSMLWVTIPPILLLSAYYIRKWYLARRLRIHGIGKGAPGFQTNVRRVRVTPEIAARIRRGEQVSPEEIEAASKKADEEEVISKSSSNVTPSSIGVTSLPTRIIEERDDRIVTAQKKKDDPVENEWLPDSITGPKKRRTGKKR